MAPNFLRDLTDRRVPQYSALYVAGGWGVVQFFSFAEERYFLSPHLTDLVLLMVALLLPSVLIFTWFHGRPGVDRWHRVEKFVIPLNIVATAAVLFAVFSGKELGAVTAAVTVRDADGNTIERVVPKAEFQKRLALFPLESDTGADRAWLGDAIMVGLAAEVVQDAFVDARPPVTFREQLREAGFADGRGVPAALKKRITNELHLQYWVDGDAAQTAGGYRVRIALHDASVGRMITERVHEGTDLLQILDVAAVELRADLGIPARYIEETADLPARELLTASVPALRSYSEALTAQWVHDDYPRARDLLRAAVAADPAFALAHLLLYQIQILMGNSAGAREALARTMDHDYRLPERIQYMAKAEWFAMQQDLPRAFAAYEMWAELYPQDIQAQLAAAQMRVLQDDRAGAIERYTRVLEIDPTRMDLLLVIGDLHDDRGDADRARQAFEQYAEAFPEDAKAIVRLAGVHAGEGEHAEARRLYERALLLDPADIATRLALAALDRDTGRFDDALRGLEAAVASARTADQRAEALMALRVHHDYRGAHRRALDAFERGVAELSTSQPPIVLVQTRLLALGLYVHAGLPDSALTMLEVLGPQLAPPIDALVPIGRILAYSALEQPGPLEAAVLEAEAMLERTGLRTLQKPVIGGRVQLHELRSEWREAAATLERERELDPSDLGVAARLGRVHRELGDLDEADRQLSTVLRGRPSHPRANYDLALVHEARGRTADAVRHLQIALETWSPADPDHPGAARAREKLAALQQSR